MVDSFLLMMQFVVWYSRILVDFIYIHSSVLDMFYDEDGQLDSEYLKRVWNKYYEMRVGELNE